LGWLFFRSQSIEQAIALLQRGLTPWEYSFRALPGTFYLQTVLLVVAVWLAPLVTRWCAVLVPSASIELPRPRLVTAAVLQGAAVGVMLALCLVYMRGQNAFIYFQF
jgi:hypothetical protein